MTDSIDSFSSLAAFLGITEEKLFSLTSSNGKAAHYKRFTIPKKSGGLRIIEAPREDLKAVQSSLASLFSEHYKAPKCVHGFVEGRSVATNASCHANKQVVVSLDIEDFFPSITPKRVCGLLEKRPFSYPYDVANAIASLVCSDNGLPQGSPSSPILANMICRGMDKKLVRIAKDIGAFYTRYADDLTFSFGNYQAFRKAFYSGESFAVPADIVLAITRFGSFSSFAINDSKTRYRRRYMRQEVTGITVNEKANLPRSYYRHTRAVLHRWRTEGAERAAKSYYKKDDVSQREVNTIEDVIRGRLSYYQMVLGENAKASTPLQTLGSMFNEQCKGKPFPIHRATDSLFYLWVEADPEANPDLENTMLEATGFLLGGFGIITAKHTFNRAKHTDGWYEVTIRNMKECREYKFRLHIDDARIHPSYDYIVIPIDDAPNPIKRTAPLAKSINIALAGSEVSAYRVCLLEGGDCEMRLVKGAVTRLPERPNQYGSVVSVNATYHHGMSGGPVLNNNGEVVGTVYSAAFDQENSKFLSITSLGNHPELVQWLDK